MEHQIRNIDELRDRIAGARYEIDPVAIADAIIRRHSNLITAGAAAPCPAAVVPRHTPTWVRPLARRRSRRADQALAA